MILLTPFIQFDLLIQWRASLPHALKANKLVTTCAMAAHCGAVLEWFHPDNVAAMVAAHAIDFFGLASGVRDDPVAKLPTTSSE